MDDGYRPVVFLRFLAERVGFEPTVRLTARPLSRQVGTWSARGLKETIEEAPKREVTAPRRRGRRRRYYYQPSTEQVLGRLLQASRSAAAHTPRAQQNRRLRTAGGRLEDGERQ